MACEEFMGSFKRFIVCGGLLEKVISDKEKRLLQQRNGFKNPAKRKVQRFYNTL